MCFLLFVCLCTPVVVNAQTNAVAIACWGDSKTQGEQEGEGMSYPAFLQELLEAHGYTYVVNNFGAHGERSTEIMQRQGSRPLTVQPFTIPASAQEEVKIVINSRLRVPEAGCNPCLIDGVEGTIRHDWTDSSQKTFYFRRLQSGTVKKISSPTRIVTDAMLNHRNEILVLDIGYNGGFSGVNDLISQCQEMIDYSECKEYVVIGRASHYYGISVGLESAFTNYFGNHYINLRDYYVNHGLEDMNITPTDGDIQDMQSGFPPRSLFYDEHHENIKGYRIKANLVFRKLLELGYLNEPTMIPTVTHVGYEENAVYDLQGRKVLRVIKSGIYLLNGKKVYLKP